MNVAYIRVSTAEQNEARQIQAMERYNIEKFFTEKISGKNTNRPKLQELLDFVRAGDTVHIHDLSRLARNTADLLNIVELLTAKGVALVSNKESIDTGTPTGRLFITIIGAIAEFERANLLERQREGIAIAKAQGKYKGGKRKQIRDFESYYSKYLSREIPSKSELARQLHISRPTLDRIIKEYTEQGEHCNDAI